MVYFVNILIMLLLIRKAQQQSIFNNRIISKKDVSEYCKRRVLPSIFLAKSSVDTSGFIMHFSRIELPYSCSISVRTEAGNNIIMAISISPLKGMKRRCEANQPELIVYEMGETFGGYWGPMEQNVLMQESMPSKIYTLKHRESVPEEPVVTLESSPEQTETTKPVETQSPVQKAEDSSEEDVISVEVPLVNVSGKFMFNEKPEAESKEENELFDLQYNVTPEPGVKYETSVMPIVQFSVKRHPGWRKEGDDEPRFDLDIVEKYTPDHRLTIPHYISTRRLKFRKLSSRTTTKRRYQYFRKITTRRKLQTPQFTSHKYTDYIFPTTKYMKTLQTVSKSYSWENIEKLINEVNLTASLQKEGDNKLSDKKIKILQEISDMKHNFSIYLMPNLSLYDSSKPRASTIMNTNTLSTSKFNEIQTKYTTKGEAVNEVKSTLIELINQTSSHSTKKHDNENYYHKEHTTSVIDEVISTKVFNGTDTTNPTDIPDKSLVDHESWENVVKAAPDMAVLLNITKEDITKHNAVTDYKNSGLRKKKREIHSIKIKNARPHNVTMQSPTMSSSISSYAVTDLQEFSQLVEVSDDELYGRLALRFMRQLVGRVLYNVCDVNTTAKKHHVHFFNTSRIVIAINNFSTLASMTIILSSARALVAGEMECPENNIECQVSGARVCIDAMAACDGVPNCGSYDIYDEDRLMCGASEGLQHNVYIAAFTFLAVLLTVLYSVHYWLRRCVPKVAQAFFIYTDGAENVLHLQPKMRSPHDYGDQESKLFYHPSMLEADDVILNEEVKPNFCKRFMNILCCGLIARKSATETRSSMTGDRELINQNPKKEYSFPQLEIQKMMGGSKMSIRSVDNFELRNIGGRKIEVRVSPPVIPVLKSADSILTLEEPFPDDYKDELGLLKFLKTVRNHSLNSESIQVESGTLDRYSISLDKNTEEMEIKNVEYNRQLLAEPGPSGVKPKNKKEWLEKPGPSGIQTTKQAEEKSATKRLRFNDTTTMIPASIAEVDEEDELPTLSSKHSTFFDTVMGKQKYFRASDDDHEAPLPKEQKRFWSRSGKAKKPS